MAKLPINEVLAVNLAHFMKEKGFTQSSLGRRAGIAQRTIGNYLKPELRQAESKSGKAASAKLTEVEKIAEGLGVEVWELLRPITPQEREFYRQIEESFNKLRRIAPGLQPAPEPVEQEPHS
jgi:transcriptional regulator with XRE-family HTH domain